MQFLVIPLLDKKGVGGWLTCALAPARTPPLTHPSAEEGKLLYPQTGPP